MGSDTVSHEARTQIEPMIERLIRKTFHNVPKQTVIVYDWHSEQGKEFLDICDKAIEAGMEPAKIGAMIGVHNFSSRYRILRRQGGNEPVDGGEGDDGTDSSPGQVEPL